MARPSRVERHRFLCNTTFMSRRPRHEPESSSVSIAWFLALAAYCVALPLLLELALPADSSGQPSVWELGARGFPASALAFGVRTLIRMTLLVPIGFFAALTLPRQSRWFRRVLMVSIPAGGIAVVLAFVVSGFAGGSGWEAPRLLTLALPAMAALVGVWIGVCASNGLGSFILFFPKFAVLVVAVGLIAVAFFYLATEDYPLDLKTPQLSTDIRRELVTRFRGHNPMKLRLGETRTLTVSAQDLERLAAWGVSVTPATSQLAIQTSSESGILAGVDPGALSRPLPQRERRRLGRGPTGRAPVLGKRAPLWVHRDARHPPQSHLLTRDERRVARRGGALRPRQHRGAQLRGRRRFRDVSPNGRSRRHPAARSRPTRPR